MSLRFWTRLQEERGRRGWSQADLAERAGLSRAAVSAIETGRVVPSTAAALGLAAVLGLRVEQIFGMGEPAGTGEVEWAWEPQGREARYWLAEVRSRVRRYPVEGTALGVMPHDGIVGASSPQPVAHPDPRRTLVVAGCDPAVGILAGAVANAAGVRLLPFVRSSRRALDLLRAGSVHVAGVHLGEEGRGNARVVRDQLGRGYRLLHLARWTEGVAVAPGLGTRSVNEVVRAKLRWVGREEGSGARRCLDLILEGRRTVPEGYEHTASDHRGVVETIRSGWAQAGVCVQLAADEGGLDFLAVRKESYDLCFAADLEDDPRVTALLDVVRGQAFGRVLAELPGYDARRTGDLL